MTAWGVAGIAHRTLQLRIGCGCNFQGFPNSVEGNCEAFVCSVIEVG
jgi:hypothetical protein